MDRTTKDKKMAAMLKANNVERRRARCPLCYKIIRMKPFAAVSDDMHRHISACN